MGRDPHSPPPSRIWLCFNSRARMGRDNRPCTTSTSSLCFNSRARMGRDEIGEQPQEPDPVSIHAPAWGATVGSRLGVHSRSFQFTRPHGARRGRPSNSSRANWFQFTRPHGARPPRPFRCCRRAAVSIHAPAWGATCREAPQPHALAFQFTRPHGARLPHLGMVPVPRVSIHAPAWGATERIVMMIEGDRFQFTRPHGARLQRRSNGNKNDSFNSRARMGRDEVEIVYAFTRRVFQFTRPHGARRRGRPR